MPFFFLIILYIFELSAVIKAIGDVTKLFCSHSMSNYNTILWYYQKQGGQSIHLIGYTFHESPNLENPKEKRFKMAGDGKKSVSLEISELSVNDSAVYFCAASEHSVAASPLTLQKALCLPLPKLHFCNIDFTEPHISL
uniref:Ig-like domain-containing protein n=1 Tax=Electrophorus electricus TaxID=8005 RepID=A0A4W4E531_ELEEL